MSFYPLYNVTFAPKSHHPHLHQETPPCPWKPDVGRKSLLPPLWSPSQTPRLEAGAPQVRGGQFVSQQAQPPVSREGGGLGNTRERRQQNGAGLGPAPGCLKGSKPSRVPMLWGCPVGPATRPATPSLGSRRIHDWFFPGTSRFLAPGHSASLSRNSSNAKLFTN